MAKEKVYTCENCRWSERPLDYCFNNDYMWCENHEQFVKCDSICDEHPKDYKGILMKGENK